MSAARVATSLVDAYNRHDLAGYAALHAPTARITFANAPGAVDLDGWMQVLARLFTALPDLRLTPVSACGSGSHAVVEVRQTGTNTGALVLDDGAREVLACSLDHIPPTGRPVDVAGVVVLGVAAGAVVSERHHWPRAWLYEQLGLATVTVRPTTTGTAGRATSLPPP